MKVLVLGAGYVGSVTAACLAGLGHVIEVVDLLPEKVAALREGRSPVREAGLEELLTRAVAEGRLTASDRSTSFDEFDIALVCVATPAKPTGMPDTGALQRVLTDLARLAVGRATPLTVAVRSTVLAPLVREVERAACAAAASDSIRLVLNPEFLREGSAVRDFYEAPFVVAGGDDADAVARTLALYDGIKVPQIAVSLELASLVKYASNALHATKVAFANEMSVLASLVGTDPVALMDVVCRDRRLNASGAYLRPGFAFGGSCLPKDLSALEAFGRQHHETLPLLSAVSASNRQHLDRAVKALTLAPGRRIAVLGLSFKSGSDDLRDSPYVHVVETLLSKGYRVRVHDPDVDPALFIGANRTYASEHLPHIQGLLVGSVEEALEDCEAVVLCKPLVAHAALRSLLAPGVPVYDLELLMPELDRHTILPARTP